MNQTQKRLSIIKLAISITDIETIQLQISKLRLLKADPQIYKIIEALESESYAQAQSLIQAYINTPIQEVHQRVSDEQQAHTYTPREQELIDEFDLFISEHANKEENEVVDVNRYLQTSAVSSKEKKDKSEMDLDKLLEMDEDEPKERKAPITSPKDTMIFESDTQPQEAVSTMVTTSGGIIREEENIPEPSCDEPHSEKITQDIATPEEKENKEEAETVTAPEKETISSNAEDLPRHNVNPRNSNTNYRPIFSIKQQFHEASEKYPLLSISREPYDSVEKWIAQISHEHGYTNTDVEKTVVDALKLAEDDNDSHKAEAAELLLLSGLTEDAFGQLVLARELFKGRLFKKDIPEAFQRIEELTEREYPEAICDLAQFYEHGIGTKKNKKRAKALYKKAMHSGINRAQKHYERLNKEGGLFSF